jgi:hypothetical protein
MIAIRFSGIIGVLFTFLRLISPHRFRCSTLDSVVSINWSFAFPHIPQATDDQLETSNCLSYQMTTGKRIY